MRVWITQPGEDVAELARSCINTFGVGPIVLKTFLSVDLRFCSFYFRLICLRLRTPFRTLTFSFHNSIWGVQVTLKAFVLTL